MGPRYFQVFSSYPSGCIGCFNSFGFTRVPLFWSYVVVGFLTSVSAREPLDFSRQGGSNRYLYRRQLSHLQNTVPLDIMKKQAEKSARKNQRADIGWSERKSVRIVGGLILLGIAFVLAVWLLPAAARLGQTTTSTTTSVVTSTTQTTTAP